MNQNQDRANQTSFAWPFCVSHDTCEMNTISTALNGSHPEKIGVAMPMFRSLLRGANPLCHAASVCWWPQIGMPIRVVISWPGHVNLDMLTFFSTALVSVVATDCSSIWPWLCAAMASKSIFHPMTVHLSELWGVGGLCTLDLMVCICLHVHLKSTYIIFYRS